MNNLRLHHIGVATRGIARELPGFEALGYKPDGDYFTDQTQKIRGLFISAPGQPVLELLENLHTSGPLDSCLAKGIKFYHFAYATDNIERSRDELAAKHGAKVIVPVTAAEYFKKVCFLMLPNMMMIELVQLQAASA